MRCPCLSILGVIHLHCQSCPIDTLTVPLSAEPSGSRFRFTPILSCCGAGLPPDPAILALGQTGLKKSEGVFADYVSSISLSTRE